MFMGGLTKIGLYGITKHETCLHKMYTATSKRLTTTFPPTLPLVHLALMLRQDPETLVLRDNLNEVHIQQYPCVRSESTHAIENCEFRPTDCQRCKENAKKLPQNNEIRFGRASKNSVQQIILKWFCIRLLERVYFFPGYFWSDNSPHTRI